MSQLTGQCEECNRKTDYYLRFSGQTLCDLCCEQQVYRLQHSTKGCRITHMFGVPLMIASVFFLNAKLFVLSAAIQIAGHLIFEQNFPSLANSSNWLITILTAIKSCAKDWKKLFTTGTLVLCMLFPAAANAEQKKKL